MISEEDKKIILKYAKEYKLSSVILFGSALTSETPNDIDLGVKVGIKSGHCLYLS